MLWSVPPRRRSWTPALLQVAVVAGFAALYFGVRGLTVGDVDQAERNAARVLRWEQFVGLNVEHAVQSPLRGSPALTTLVNWVYIWGHWPVIILVLWWLLLRHPVTFAVTRDALLLSGAVGMVVFAAFPVAPPRLVDMGLLDTVTEHSQAYRVLQPHAFVNPYAAMPSLHMGWDLLVGIAVAGAARRWWVRAAGLALPLLMAWAVVASANHYVLDAVAGAALVLACRILVVRLRQTIAQRGEPRTAAARSERQDPAGRRPGVQRLRLARCTRPLHLHLRHVATSSSTTGPTMRRRTRARLLPGDPRRAPEVGIRPGRKSR